MLHIKNGDCDPETTRSGLEVRSKSRYYYSHCIINKLAFYHGVTRMARVIATVSASLLYFPRLAYRSVGLSEDFTFTGTFNAGNTRSPTKLTIR